jgi:catechol 2,3-dioxygenase-like lactoylglutathione lyase family enzyme
MAVLTGISPVLLVADLQRSVDYFSNRLGFECHAFGDPPNFATAARDAAVILSPCLISPSALWLTGRSWTRCGMRTSELTMWMRSMPRFNSEALASTTRSTTPRTAFASSA